MRYYVYPSGQTGKLLAEMIKFVDGDKADIILLDDAKENFTLMDFKNEILECNAKIFLSWNKKSGGNDRTIACIIDRLKSDNINYEEDAFFRFTKEVLKKIHVILGDQKKIVAIELNGLAKNKHIGFLDDELSRHKDIFILYLCATMESLEDISFKINIERIDGIAVPFPCEHTDLLSGVDVICKTSFKEKNDNVATIYLDHGLTDWSKILNVNFLKYMDYLCVGIKGFAPKRTLDDGVVCLKSGYLGFDIQASSIQLNSKKDSVLFAPYDEEEFFKMLPFMQEGLKKYKVILRSRIFFEGEHLWKKAIKEIDALRRNKNFILDDGWQMSDDSYEKSFCLVCEKSSSRFSFPILALSPSVVLMECQENECIRKFLGNDTKNFMNYLDNLYSDKELISNKILEYRNENVYNFGKSSKYLADFIITILL